MAGVVDNDTRDFLISTFRERVAERIGMVPFMHQREVWLATDGLRLSGEFLPMDSPDGVLVQLETKEIVRMAVETRPEGRARFVSDLGSFKIGKSYGAAIWGTGFAAVPKAKTSLIGLEYNTCEPEFNYIADALLSERGMNMKAKSFVNRPRQGEMYLELENGSVYECRSWERKESLKGKENDCYIYCEAYQLPGMECFTAFSQNLRVRRGYAYFATTPDRPWVQLLHDQAHGKEHDPEWHCTCGVSADANPISFDAKAKERDRKLMTKEKFEIHYNGKLGNFVGQVFNYNRGSAKTTFTAVTHPELFPDGKTSRESLRIPSNWTVQGGMDTGTFYSGLLVAFSPEGEAFVLDEFPNYRYLAGEAERDEQLSIPQWARTVLGRSLQLNGRSSFWADPNSQFKGELRNYGVNLMPANVPVETRTEITREYFEHSKIRLAPWLEVLPFELENAKWPEEASLSGRFQRIKDRDHTLDPLEHILARRPLGRRLVRPGSRTWAQSQGLKSKRQRRGNIHTGDR